MPSVCLLDTGVNSGHPLLNGLLEDKDVSTIIPVHGVSDSAYPHGTPMAGLAAYGDLRDLMLSTAQWVQRHKLESVKVIHEGEEHDPNNYGEVTKQAIILPEVESPRRKRVYSLAITDGSGIKGEPSSWSSAVDAAVAGVGEENASRRVVFISAGNVDAVSNNNYSYPRSNENSSIQNPAQAWNAVTVGAKSIRTNITEDDDESRRSKAIAPSGALSPHSTTSIGWDSHWPIKPDIVMEGCNLAQTESGEIVEKESLELVSTASKFMNRPLCRMFATSAATALAARLGAQLLASYPDYWAETYRGLMVHSAEWSSPMLDGLNPHQQGNASAVQNVMRRYGFGEPNPVRLLGSGESGVTMIFEDSIQPYDPDSKAGNANLGYFNLHDLPWPKEIFENNPEVSFKLKVTLSYFIEPNPSSKCIIKGSKYRYSSHLLRFTVKRATEDERTFQRALQKLMEEDNSEEDGSASRAGADARWAIGPKLRGKAGSIVQDIWEGSAADLKEMGQIAIFPAKGWFATRRYSEGHEYFECHKRPVRYSLIVSIDTQQDVGLYSAISNIVSVNA